MRMVVLLGDEVTLMKGETWVTGKVAGLVLDDKRELERIYLHDIGYTFWMNEGWVFVEEEEEWDEEEE